MAPLPTVAGSNNSWGTELNTWLQVEHDADGTHAAALSALNALTPAADKLAYFTSGSAAALASLSSFGRSLIDDADAAAGRTTLGLGTSAVKDTGNAADKILLTDANADVTLATSVYASGAITGGKLKAVSSVVFNSKNTLTNDPTDSAIGSPVIVDFDNIINNTSGTQATGFFGPRGIHSIEGRVSYSSNAATWQLAPIGYTDQLIVRNTPTQARTLVPSWQYMDARIWAAEGAAVIAQKSDISPFGPVAFVDNQTMLTTNSGSWSTTGSGQGTDLTLGSFVSMPVVAGNTTLSRRVGFQVLDVGLGGSAWATTLNGTGLRAKLSADVDSATGVVTEQYGILIPRLLNAATNIGIQCDTQVKLWADSPTFTAAQPSILSLAPGTQTWDYVNVNGSLVSWTGTVKAKQAGSGFGSLQLFKAGGIFTNTTTFTGALGPASMFLDNATVQGDTNATTMTTYSSFHGNAQLTKVGTGTLTVTDMVSFNSQGGLGAGTTATTFTAFKANQPTNAGTITTLLGVDIVDLTNGATNLSVRSAGEAVQMRHRGDAIFGSGGIATAPRAKLHVHEATEGDPVAAFDSTAGVGGNAYTSIRQDSVQTTDATANVTALTIPTVSNTAYLVMAWVVGRNTTDNTTSAWMVEAAFYNNAGTLTQQGSDVTHTINAIGVTPQLNPSGTNILAAVTGVAAKTIKWHVNTWITEVT